jgi:outer membrane lipoprotein LolB
VGWQLNGRIAIAKEDEHWTAHVYWHQRDADYQIRFNAPLGQGVMLLQGNEGGVMMRTADNQTLVASNPDALVVKAIKLEIPVSGLYFWIRGLPGPTALNYQLNEAGYLYHLQQDGWDIEYGNYVNAGEVALPAKIYLENKRVKVKIVISQWDVKNPTSLSPLL